MSLAQGHPLDAPSAAPSREVLRVLLVEDDLVDQLAFRRQVQRDGLHYEVVTATSLAAAQALLASGPFDVVVTDYRLPDGTAFDVAGMLDGRPWIVVTGEGGESVAVDALRAGAHDYVVKRSDGAHLELLRYSIDSAARLAQSQAENRLLSCAMSSTLDAVYITDTEGKIIFANGAFERLYGYPHRAAVGRSQAMLWLAGAIPWRYDPAGPASWSEETTHLRVDGTAVPVWLSCSRLLDHFDRCTAFVCTARDVTDRRRFEEKLKHANQELELSRRTLQELAIRDELTRLFNRRELIRLFDEELARSRRFSRHLSLVLIDVDHFKAINDNHGHAVGDEVLKHLADLLRASLRNIDWAGRVGGEEFALLLPETDARGAATVADRLRRRLAGTPCLIGDVTRPVLDIAATISAGVAAALAGESFADTLARADRALYRAKQGGRNRVEIAGDAP